MVSHPLDMLTGDEITGAVALIRSTGRLPEKARFAQVVLHEPEKGLLNSWRQGDPIDREVRALVVPGPDLQLVETVVSVTHAEVRQWSEIEGMRPAVMVVEALKASDKVKENADYRDALALRGISDMDQVQIDTWPAGVFGYEAENGRRLCRCLSYFRQNPEDNGYSRPIEGVLVNFDLGRNEVIEVIDHGVSPLPPHASYLAKDQPTLRTDLKPISITQPEGTSFAVDGNLISWQKWQFRISFDPYEGLVLHQVGYEDDENGVRSILHRASICEMVVPYGDPLPVQGWKNAFDAGEAGLGRMTQPLALGCDCVGEIHYFDATLATDTGKARVIENAICMHEEDYGILWKHVDLQTGTSEVRRSRRLVVSFMATLANYEYGFFWYFYLDGSIQMEVKLTGIVSPMAIERDTKPEYANVVADGVAAVHHQHLFCARLDFDIDGADNDVFEVEAEPAPPGLDNPWSNAFRQKATKLSSELVAQRDTNAGLSRSWRIANSETLNGLGQPVAYKLIPTMSTPTMLAHPDSSVGKRAGFARHNFWVTPYEREERRAAGEFPNQHEGGDGLPLWTAQDRSIERTDIVCWYTFGLTHFARPEDFPVMPVEYTGFLLAPCGFFDRNPALDVPPSHPAHCK